MTSSTTHANQPIVDLNDGQKIPQLGYGVWQIADDHVADLVEHAIDTGYRSIDTAMIYENERGVGEGIRRTSVERDELFITSKLWNSDHGFDAALRGFDATMDRLQLDVLDLFLIHWPAPQNDIYVDTWKALCRLHQDGRVKSIGVSNFHRPHLERIIDATGIVPAVNQIELHPYFQQRELKEFHDSHNIATEAWSPLGQGGTLLREAVIKQIADEIGCSSGQVVLAWHRQRGHIAIPKSETPSRIVENFASLTVELSSAQLEQIDAMDRADGRLGPNPETAEF